MKQPRVGRVGYINCLPVFYALERGMVNLAAEIVADHPRRLNRMLASGEIQVTAVSSIAYAMHRQSCVVLPGISIASDGPVWSVVLLSRRPVQELGGRRISLTPHSATSVALLRILLERFYGITAEFFTRPSGESPWWGDPDATLVIGDEALRLIQEHTSGTLEDGALPVQGRDCYIYDLGAEWHRYTGKRMVFALWVARREFARQHPGALQEIWQAMQAARQWGDSHREDIAGVAAQLVGLPSGVLNEYFQHLKYDLSEPYLEGLHLFYDYAREAGMLEEPVRAEIWRMGADVYHNAAGSDR